MNGNTPSWLRYVRGLLEIAAILVAIGFYVATIQSNTVAVQSNIRRIDILQSEYEAIVPLSETDRAVNNQRYADIQRQLDQIQMTLRQLDKK